MNRRSRGWLLAFCLLGLAASGEAAYVHYRIIRDPSYTSFCDISQTINCEAVYQSRFGSVGGVPVALGGVIWFALATMLTFWGRAGSARSGSTARASHRAAAPSFSVNVPAYLFVLSVVALAVVLYLAYASFFVLKTVCLLCLVTYGAVASIFVISGAATDATMSSVPARALGDLRALVSNPLALAIGFLFVAGAATAVGFFPRDAGPARTAGTAASAAADQDQRSEFERWFASQARVPIMVPSEGAQVLVVKFNDYQCPPCRQTYLDYKGILAKFQASRPGAVKLVTKDYPLDPECNVNVPGGQHVAACEAAVAVRLARGHGRAEAMEGWLFANQPSLTPPVVRQAARDVGQVPDFDAQYPRTLELVKGDIALGAQLDVRATPTFFINGVKVQGGLQPVFFEQAIELELKRATGSTIK